MKRGTPFLWICLVIGVSSLFANTNADAMGKGIHGMKTDIRIEIKSEGGFAYIPGLSKPAIVDSDTLSQEQVEKLQRLIEEAKFFELPGSIAATSSGAADYQTYTIIIETDGRRHRVEFTDLVDNPALKRLFAFLKSLPSDQQ